MTTAAHDLFCPACGQQLPGDAGFCRECGHDLTARRTSLIPTLTPEPAPEPAPFEPAPAEEPPPGPRFDRRVVAAAVAVLVGGGIAAALLLGGGSDDPAAKRAGSTSSDRAESGSPATTPEPTVAAATPDAPVDAVVVPEATVDAGEQPAAGDDALAGQVQALDGLMQRSKEGRAAALDGDFAGAIANRSALLGELQSLRTEATDPELRAALGSFVAAIRESLRQNRDCAAACSAADLRRVGQLKEQALAQLNPLLREHLGTSYDPEEI